MCVCVDQEKIIKKRPPWNLLLGDKLAQSSMADMWSKWAVRSFYLRWWNFFLVHFPLRLLYALLCCLGIAKTYPWYTFSQKHLLHCCVSSPAVKIKLMSFTLPKTLAFTLELSVNSVLIPGSLLLSTRLRDLKSQDMSCAAEWLWPLKACLTLLSSVPREILHLGEKLCRIVVLFVTGTTFYARLV